MKDAQSRYLYANKKTLAFFAELINRSDAAFSPPATTAKLPQIDQQALHGKATQEEAVIEREGRVKEVHLELKLELKSPVYADKNPDEVVGVLGILTNITHQKHLENLLITAATQDALTRLSNRRPLLERLEMVQKRSQRSKTHCAVIFLDLDCFKQLNDCYGHGVGDTYLIEVARRIRNEVRDLGSVARIGGDEFVVLLEGLSCGRLQACNSVKRVAQKIINALGVSLSPIL